MRAHRSAHADGHALMARIGAGENPRSRRVDVAPCEVEARDSGNGVASECRVVRRGIDAEPGEDGRHGNETEGALHT